VEDRNRLAAHCQLNQLYDVYTWRGLVNAVAKMVSKRRLGRGCRNVVSAVF